MNRGFIRASTLLLALFMAFSLSAGALSADKAATDKVRADIAAIILNTVKNPAVDSIGGE